MEKTVRYIALLAVAVLLAACSLNPIKDRARLLAPDPTLPSDIRSYFVTEFATATTAAQSHPSASNMERLVDAGSALNAINCGEWMDRDNLAAQGLVLSDHDMGVASSLITAIAGMAELSSKAVTGIGAAGIAVQGFNHNLRNALGAPAAYQAQATMLNALGSCSDQLLVRSRELKVSQVILGIDACRRICSAGAASAITTQALQQTQVEVQGGPVSAPMLRLSPRRTP